MTAKDYLGQAYRLDQRINSKIDQITSLSDLATKCTSTISDMPKNPSPSSSPMADIVCKIIDLQAEINTDIDRLVELKRDIVRTIKSVDNSEYQTLLELRYLCFKTWEQIAVDMGYRVRNAHTLHNEALKKVVVI